MLSMLEKGIRGGICHPIHRYETANKKYMKDHDKESYRRYWYVNKLYGRAMSQKFPVNNFESIEGISPFNEDFIKIYNEENGERNFLEVDVQYRE